MLSYWTLAKHSTRFPTSGYYASWTIRESVAKSWIGLHHSWQSVVCDGSASTAKHVISGVPQGTVLGPLLFLVYINDLPSHVQSTPRLFADDCLLYRRINARSDCDILQNDLDRLQEWVAIWQMCFNPDKCEVLRVTWRTRNAIVIILYQ